MRDEGRGVRSRMALGLVTALFGLAACADPRGRPVPPQVALNFDTAQVVRSPGIIVGTVHIVASGGLDFLHLTLATADSSFLLDTLEGYAGEGDITRPIQWAVLPGLAVGTTLRFTVLARDFEDFEKVATTTFETRP